MKRKYSAPKFETIELFSENVCQEDFIDVSAKDNLAPDITPGNDQEDLWIE